MNRGKTIASLVAIPAILTGLAIGLHSSSAQDPAPKVDRVTWEYKTTDRDDVGRMNELGRDGWELAGVVSPTSPAHAPKFIFKRPKE